MKGQRMANYAAIAGIIAGLVAIAGGLYAHSQHPIFGYPRFYGIHSHYLSGVHVLVGVGVLMIVGGLISFKWPSVGASIVCFLAMIGLIYTYNRGQYHWIPLVYYWWGPWLFAWLAGIFAGYSLFQRVEQLGTQESSAVERT
jgi:hypothetical protein